MIKKIKPNFSLISEYRNMIMGLAIIFIMFCHLDVAQKNNGIAVTSLASHLHVLTVGVDVFFFLSGFGLYYSYTKNKPSYWSFEKRRLMRVFPLYFIMAGITYFLSDIIIKHAGFITFLRDLFFITWFREGVTRYWYILATAVFYLLFPLIYRYLCGGKNGLVKSAAFCVCWWLLVEILRKVIPATGNLRIALARLPIFVIGVYAGKLSFHKAEIRKGMIIFFLVIGYAVYFGMKLPLFKRISGHAYYAIRAFLGISIITTAIVFLETVKGRVPVFFKWITSILSWFGGLTLEIYLLHQSYGIVFNYPYKIPVYIAVTVVLPTVTAGLINYGRYTIQKK